MLKANIYLFIHMRFIYWLIRDLFIYSYEIYFCNIYEELFRTLLMSCNSSIHCKLNNLFYIITVDNCQPKKLDNLLFFIQMYKKN